MASDSPIPERPPGFVIADRSEPLAEFVRREGPKHVIDGKFRDWAAVNVTNVHLGDKVLVPKTPDYKRKYLQWYNHVILSANKAPTAVQIKNDRNLLFGNSKSHQD